MGRVLASITAGMVENVFIGSPANYPEAVDVTAVTPRPAPGWTYSAGAFNPPAAAPDQPAVRRITQLAFWNRFTLPERIAIDMASIDNPAAALAIRQQSSALRDLRQQVNSANFIDVERADTRAGVQQLESIGLLAAGRAMAILDAPIQPHEVPLL